MDDSIHAAFTSTPSGTIYTTTVYPVVTSIFPKRGSIAGGTKLTINGYGFTPNLIDIIIKVGNIPCDVVSSSAYSIVCTTQPISDNLQFTEITGIIISHRYIILLDIYRY